MKLITDWASARALLARPAPYLDLQASPRLAEGIRRLFGESLSPEQAVARILADVRRDGDRALLDYTYRLDGVALDAVEVPPQSLQEAWHGLAAELKDALGTASRRIRAFHERCLREGWIDRGLGLGQALRPLERVGLYVPGGSARYPSTVLMSAIPARVAGVREVILATPPGRDGRVPQVTLAAASLAGVDRVYAMGGAQAIAALAYGTESVPRVDKVCGPGNIFVTLAKKMVFGTVDIDGLFGPTETLLLADDSADPALCARDLLAQAEHDPLASPLLITTSLKVAQAVARQVEEQLARLERREIAAAAVEGQGAVVVVDSLERAFELANSYAPEHLALLVRDPWTHLDKVRHAGAVFLGEASGEALGDYIAGPSHVLPTGGTARFSSPLGVETFLRRMSVIGLDEATSRALAQPGAVIARAEGLGGHAAALEAREEPREKKPEYHLHWKGLILQPGTLYIGIDLTDPYAKRPRPVTRAMMSDALKVDFDEWEYNISGQGLLVNEGSAIVAIDGPQGLATNGTGMRECERVLGAPGKTPDHLPQPQGVPFVGFIRGSVELFRELIKQLPLVEDCRDRSARLMEVYPGAAWRALTGKSLPKKSTREGRKQRQLALESCGLTLPGPLLTHDQLDAALAAYIAWCFRKDAAICVGKAPFYAGGWLREGFIVQPP